MVAGRVVMENGRLLTVDEEAIKAEARELMKAYKQELKKATEAAARLEPYSRQMYQCAAARTVGLNRWVGSNR